MDKSPTKFKGVECTVWMKEMLDKMLQIAREIKCFINPARYFKTLYTKYTYQRMKFRATEPYNPDYPSFLEYAECRIIYTMYNSICQEFVTKGLLSPSESLTNINAIEPSNILLIQCPTIFASYHFIFVVVDTVGEKVDIYQSYGNRSLYNLTLDFNEFKQHLENMQNIKSYPKQQALSMIKGFEKRVYGNNFDLLVQQQIKSTDSESDNDISSEEIIDDLYNRYIVMQENPLQIQIYKFLHSDCSTGGKRKRKTIKKRTKKFLKKSRRNNKK